MESGHDEIPTIELLLGQNFKEDRPVVLHKAAELNHLGVIKYIYQTTTDIDRNIQIQKRKSMVDTGIGRKMATPFHVAALEGNVKVRN